MTKQAKHSNVFYLHKTIDGESIFEAVEKAHAYKNDFGLDLFRYEGKIYEGRTGCLLVRESDFADFIERMKNIDEVKKLNAKLEELLTKTSETPRYTRPDERKKDIFPPAKKDENIVYAKDVYGKKHYYFRFCNENSNGIELYTLRSETDEHRRIHVNCEGYMLDIGSHYNLDERLEWLAGLEGGILGEVERLFNESMANPSKWADIGFANILGRADEAMAHNAVIRAVRAEEEWQREAKREAERIAVEAAAKEEYIQAIKTAQANILNKQSVKNIDIHGKSLIMQLFREYYIKVPLRTQGWIIGSLYDIYFNEDREEWSYQCYTKSRDSTVFSKYLSLLVSVVQAKHQSESQNDFKAEEESK